MGNSVFKALSVERVMKAADVIALQDIVRRVPCADHVAHYAMRLCRTTRRGQGDAPKFVEDYLAWGAGPRASQNLVLAGKARAILNGRFHVSIEDIRAVAHPVLRHRLITNFNAEADGIRADEIVDRLLSEVPTRSTEGIDPSMAKRVFATPPSN